MTDKQPIYILPESTERTMGKVVDGNNNWQDNKDPEKDTSHAIYDAETHPATSSHSQGHSPQSSHTSESSRHRSGSS